MTVNSSANSIILILFAFSDNLSAENSNLSAESGLRGLSLLESMIEVSFVDFGGHTEYASCSPIFIKEKAVFLICFPVAKLKDEPALDDEYFSSIGTYIQLILENCDMPIIFLVATKGDEVKDPATVKDHLSNVIATAKRQLEAIAKKSKNKKPFIFDHVIQTSLSKNADLKSMLDNLMTILVAVFGHSELKY